LVEFNFFYLALFNFSGSDDVEQQVNVCKPGFFRSLTEFSLNWPNKITTIR